MPPLPHAQTQTSEDWRILRALSLYRLLVDILLLVLLESDVGDALFGPLLPTRFHTTCVIYAMAALGLLLPVIYQRPSIRLQAPAHFAVDTLAIASLVSAAGSTGTALGMLLVTPAVSCSLVLERRPAMLQAGVAAVLLFGVELLRHRIQHYSPDLTAAAVLGLILVGSSYAANTVAQRARASEALAARAGIDLAQLSRLNERIIANLQTGVVLLDESRYVRLLNAAARRLLGLADAHPGQLLDELFPALVVALHQWRVNPARQPPPLLSPNGRLELIARPMTLGAGPQASTLILLDEAARVREQAQQMKLAALARLSASIAHEIRNPLSAIHHAGQLLAESDSLPAQDRRLVDMIERHSARIERIVQNVLDLSRRDTANPARLDLLPWLRNVVEHYEEGAPQRRGQITIDAASEDRIVSFDPGHLQRILFNLWDNSFDHGGRDSLALHVELRTGSLGAGRQPFLDISDNGRGIPTALLDRVFEPFFSTAHEGTGLGLYLSRELCDNNQARLEYRPLASGACFRIIFAAEPET